MLMNQQFLIYKTNIKCEKDIIHSLYIAYQPDRFFQRQDIRLDALFVRREDLRPRQGSIENLYRNQHTYRSGDIMSLSLQVHPGMA
ncbi:hypothetical protein EYC84_002775 [Monilinia fructicola]|uniref:Uncharacterized protein n=1 Tax=Monilinia fructicola TaxID=38448 RepID=A0A5M9JRR1_MONFR|nr:hypothetical protein EYC84_002775 [Monilinia fructicola]